MPSTKTRPPAGAVKRSRSRRAGESAFGLLLLLRQSAVAAVALLVLAAGFWTSWRTAQYVMPAKGREQGTMRVEHCAHGHCTGPYTPTSAGSRPRSRVEIGRSVGQDEGASIPVVVKPGGDEVVRAGAAGVWHAWLPLGGALLMAAVVVAGGLRMRRTAWGLGLCGFALVTLSFATA